MVISDTINDVLNNNKLKSDILVIDNGSSDSSQKIIKNSGINYLIHPVNTWKSAWMLKWLLKKYSALLLGEKFSQYNRV